MAKKSGSTCEVKVQKNQRVNNLIKNSEKGNTYVNERTTKKIYLLTIEQYIQILKKLFCVPLIPFLIMASVY
jgi:hypothetical protein